MIVDCHTHIWEIGNGPPGQGFPTFDRRSELDTRGHIDAVGPVDHAIVLGFKSRFLEFEISNDFVAKHVQQYATKLIGFAGVDPTEDHWADELERAHGELSLKGVVVAPALQDFHPTNSRAMSLYEACVAANLPIVFELDHRAASARLDFARPLLLDEVARSFPALRMVITHLGYPWVDETLALLAKHPHVYADIAGLLRRPYQAYTALLGAFEYGVFDKLLFGSDFPYRSPAASIEALYSVNQLSYGTNLSTIPREHLRGIVERDTLHLLGLKSGATNLPSTHRSLLPDDEY